MSFLSKLPPLKPLIEPFTGGAKPENLTLEPRIGDCAATQPCSGVRVVDVRVFGPAAGASAPEVVCMVKNAA